VEDLTWTPAVMSVTPAQSHRFPYVRLGKIFEKA